MALSPLITAISAGYRLRVSDWRILCDIDEVWLMVEVMTQSTHDVKASGVAPTPERVSQEKNLCSECVKGDLPP
jgi:hypothetical protein